MWIIDLVLTASVLYTIIDTYRTGRGWLVRKMRDLLQRQEVLEGELSGIRESLTWIRSNIGNSAQAVKRLESRIEALEQEIGSIEVEESKRSWENELMQALLSQIIQKQEEPENNQVAGGLTGKELRKLQGVNSR